jgi:hypothetical protein
MASGNPMALCHPLPYGGNPWHCATHSRTAYAPHPQKRTTKPSRGRQMTTLGPHKDNAVTSGQRGRSPPSPSVLCSHPRRPNTIPGTTSPSPTLWGGRGDKTPPRRLLCVLWPPVSRTLEPMSGRRPNERPLHLGGSEPLLDGYRARHDAPPDIRFARTVVYSVAL